MLPATGSHLSLHVAVLYTAVREAGKAGSDGMSVTIGSVSSAAKNSHTHTHYKCHYLVELHWGFLDTRTQMLAPLWGAHFTTSMQPTTPGQSRTPWHLSPCQACSRSSRVPFYPSAFLITSEIGDHHPHLLSKIIRQILGTFQTFLTPTAQWTAASWNSRVNIDVSLSHHTCYAGPCST